MRNVLILALSALSSFPAAAFVGCYHNDNDEPYESNLHSGSTNDIIEVYFDDSFTSATTINGLPQATAYQIVRQVIDAYHSEGGPSFVLRYAGDVTDWDCGDPTYRDDPVIYITAYNDIGSACGNPSAAACGVGFEDADPTEADFACGIVRFDIGFERTATLDQFRHIVLHEFGHVVGWGHVDAPNECAASFANDDSIMTIIAGTYLTFPAADKRALQHDYGPPEGQNIMWRSKQYVLTSWSASNTLASGATAFGPVGATDAPIHAQGLAYRNKPVGQGTGLRVTTYDTFAGWNTFSPVGGGTYHKPDIALAANRPGGLPTLWGAFAMTSDTVDNDNVTLRLWEKQLGGGSFSLVAGFPLGRDPFLSCAYDPRSDRFICLTRDASGDLRFLHRTPGQAGAWSDDIVEQTDFDDMGFATGADIACSPTSGLPNGILNCIAVGLAERPIPPSTNVMVVYRLFYIDANDQVFAEVPISTGFQGRLPPTVSAHPDGTNPWFIITRNYGNLWNQIAFVGLELDLDVAHFQGFPFTVTGSSVISMLPTLGSHKYNNIAYQDMVFGQE